MKQHNSKTVVQRILRVVFVLAVLIILFVGSGVLYQGISSAIDASHFPPQENWWMWVVIACISTVLALATQEARL